MEVPTASIDPPETPEARQALEDRLQEAFQESLESLRPLARTLPLEILRSVGLTSHRALQTKLTHMKSMKRSVTDFEAKQDLTTVATQASAAIGAMLLAIAAEHQIQILPTSLAPPTPSPND